MRQTRTFRPTITSTVVRLLAGALPGIGYPFRLERRDNFPHGFDIDPLRPVGARHAPQPALVRLLPEAERTDAVLLYKRRDHPRGVDDLQPLHPAAAPTNFQRTEYRGILTFA
jgi:hypothetical protein